MEKSKNGIALITGTTSGVGLNTLKPLISSGWNVIAINRSNTRAIYESKRILSDEELNCINFIEIDL